MSDRFPRAGRLSRGYAVKQVDTYLARVESALAGGRLTSRTTPAAIRRAAFDLVLHGYDVVAVDARLDELEQRAVEVERTLGHAPTYDPLSELVMLRGTVERDYGARFPRTALWRRGYSLDDVDELLDALVESLEGRPGPDADAVRRSVFRPRRGGYDEDAVDDYLDRVVDVLVRRAVRRAA